MCRMSLTFACQTHLKSVAAWKVAGKTRCATRLHTKSGEEIRNAACETLPRSACLYAGQVCCSVVVAGLFANAVCKSRLAASFHPAAPTRVGAALVTPLQNHEFRAPGRLGAG